MRYSLLPLLTYKRVSMKSAKAFQLALLHPRYWLTWFGLALLFLLVQLPYPLLNRLGVWMGRTSMRFLKRRVTITRRNLELCFPEMDEAQRERKVVGNFESLGMGLLETGMAWFWSDKRVKRWFNVSGINHLKMAQRDDRGVLVIGVHFMSLELGGRAMGLCQPMMAMYRPHNNKAMEWAQTKGRMRSNKAMIDRKDLRAWCTRSSAARRYGSRRIRTTARAAAYSPRCSPSIRPLPPAAPLCWRAWPTRRWCRWC